MKRDKNRLKSDRLLATFNNLEKLLIDVVDMEKKEAVSKKVGSYLAGILAVTMSNMIELIEDKEYYDKKYLKEIREAAYSFLHDQQLQGNMTTNNTDEEGES